MRIVSKLTEQDLINRFFKKPTFFGNRYLKDGYHHCYYRVNRKGQLQRWYYISGELEVGGESGWDNATWGQFNKSIKNEKIKMKEMEKELTSEEKRIKRENNINNYKWNF